MKIKILFFLLLSYAHLAYSNIEVTIDYKTGSRESSGYDIEYHDGQNHNEEIQREYDNAVLKALNSLQKTEGSIQNLSERVSQKLTEQFNMDVHVNLNQRFKDYLGSFNKKQRENYRQFQNHLTDDIFNPKFQSKNLNKKISFDTSKNSDLKALNTYRRAEEVKYNQFTENDRFREANFAQNLIEIRQYKSDQVDDQTLFGLNEMADSALDNEPSKFTNLLETFLAVGAFKEGFSAKMIANFNPLNVIDPIEYDCHSDACQVGELVADAISIFIGGYELISGVAISSAGGAATLALVPAIPATGGAAVAPMAGTIAVTVAGTAVAAQGATAIASGFNDLYGKISTKLNLDKIKESVQNIKEFGYKGTKKIVDSTRKLGASTKDKVLSFANSFRNNPKAFDKIDDITENITKSKAFKSAIDNVPVNKAMFYVRESGEAIPSTSYKYIDSNAPDLQKILSDGHMPARTSNRPHYGSFNKYNNANDAMDALQLAKKPDGTPWNDARYRVEFDTLQHIDEIEVPRGKWGEADYLEPLTKDYTDFGDGGATQIIFKSKTKVKEVVDLKTGEIVFPKP